MLQASPFTHPGHYTWCGTGNHEQVGGQAVLMLSPSHPHSHFFPFHQTFSPLLCLNACRVHSWWESQPRQVWVSSAPETPWVAFPLINSCSSVRKSAIYILHAIYLNFLSCQNCTLLSLTKLVLSVVIYMVSYLYMVNSHKFFKFLLIFCVLLKSQLLEIRVILSILVSALFYKT